MRAIQCVNLGLPETLQLNEVELASPGKKEVKVKIRACSINFPDTLIIQGKYQFKPDLPFIPGRDIAGVIKELGEEVKGFSVGDEVFGFTMTGGFSEECNLQAKMIFPKPPNMDFTIASAFMLAYGTSYHALVDRGQLQSGDTILILGASGGVGLAAIEIAKNIGAKVIAAASTQDKLDLCVEKGADHVINYNEENLKEKVKILTSGQGVNVVFDPVGGDYSEPALRSIAWKGRYLVVGFAAGNIPKIPLNLPLLKGCEIVGVFWGAFATKDPSKNLANSMQLVQWYSEGKIKPHIDRIYTLEETPQALRDMMERKVKGKVVIQM